MPTVELHLRETSGIFKKRNRYSVDEVFKFRCISSCLSGIYCTVIAVIVKNRYTNNMVIISFYLLCHLNTRYKEPFENEKSAPLVLYNYFDNISSKYQCTVERYERTD